MPKTTDIIKIKKLKDGTFSLTKDKNLLFMVGMAHSIQKVIFEIQKRGGNVLTNAKTFTDLLDRISESKKSILSENETFLLYEWIDCLCLFHLEIEGVEYNKKEINKFLRISQDFLKKTKIKTK